MRKYLFCAALLAALMFTGVSASTEGTPAAPTAGQLMQLIPAELQQRAKAGADLTDEQGLDTGGLTLEWGDHDGPNYILKLSAPAQGTAQGETSAKYGVFDFATGKWRIPCIYDGVYCIPEHRYFLVVQDGDRSTCYEAEADGTVNPQPLPIDGNVCGVDRQGYVTLYRTFEESFRLYGWGDMITGTYHLRSLLDNHYQIVLDYVAGSHAPAPIGFRDGVAMIETGGTSLQSGKHEAYWADSTVGFINRKGEWIGRHDYNNIRSYVNDGSNDRRWGYRDGTQNIFWIVEDGGEVELDTLSPESIRKKHSSWAKGAIEQAKERGLISETMQGYYTLAAYREELCSLLVNLYCKLGREAPALDTAPTFADCERAHVRIAAALGIVSGDEHGEIHPRSRITRQEAADMLYRFTRLFREADSTAATLYPDGAAIDERFQASAYAMRNLGVMTGLPDGNFAPNGYYPIEQAVAAVNRLYDLLSVK